jgi:hypothetical protein
VGFTGMQEKTTAKDVTGSLNGGYWMLDFIEFKAGQKQPMATYPFTFCNLSERAVGGKDEWLGGARNPRPLFLSCHLIYFQEGIRPARGFSVLISYRDYVSPSVTIGIYSSV